MSSGRPRSFHHRFGFLVADVGRLYGRRFDQLAREQIGLSRAQVRLLAALSEHEGGHMSQVELANRLELTTMGVATLCRRMEEAGWIRRDASESDRRANEVKLQPRAEKALDAAMAIGDRLQAQALGGLSAAERAQLLSLLQKARANLVGGDAP